MRQGPESESWEGSLSKKEAKRRAQSEKEGNKEERQRLDPNKRILLLNPATAEDIMSPEFSVHGPMHSSYCVGLI